MNQPYNEGPDRRPGENGPEGSPNRQMFTTILLVALVVFVLMGLLNNFLRKQSYKKVPYNQFISALKSENVDKVSVGPEKIEWTMKGDSFRSYYTPRLPDEHLVDRLDSANVTFSGVEGDGRNALFQLLIYFGPLLLLSAIMIWGYKKMAKSGSELMGMGIGKSNAKVYVQQETGVTFRDVAGEEEAKESLKEIVDFLHNPRKYTEIGAKLPKGALLVGPPGTGKTLLAKAVAGEAHVPFFSLTGSDFVEMFVGVGAKRVRDLFKDAAAAAPAIIFIDEIDAIGKSRDTAFGGNDEREQTLNQLLSEMDGFDSSKGLIVMGATNRPEVLDKALLRPGRFDRRVIVDKPDLQGRIDILKVHSRDVKMDQSVDLKAIALATSGAVGSDLANMINEGAINAVKHGRRLVTQKDLEEAVEVVLVGKEKKDRVMSQEERRIVSYHEVGHAMIAAIQKDSEPVQKITIVPRTMGALGYVMQTPEEEKFLNSKTEIESMIVTALAGRASEELVFGNVTTGAANDIEQATKYARAMITMYGMSEKFGMVALETIQSQYLDGRRVMNCADQTAAEVDKEVIRILKDSYKKAYDLLKENRYCMDAIAEHLIEKETITGKEFMEIFHRTKKEQEELKASRTAIPLGTEAPAEEEPKAEDTPKAGEAPEAEDASMAGEAPKTEEAPKAEE